MIFRNKILNSALAVLSATLIFISSTGFSLHRHICACKKEVVFSIFPEIFGLHQSCCCSAKGENNDIIFIQKQYLKRADCCKNVYSFHKSEINAYLLNAFLKVEKSFSNNISIKFIEFERQAVKSILPLYRPPPLMRSGQALVLFLHNLKIPLSESLI